MAKTITEIASEVLEVIGRLPDGQVAPASQLNKVKSAYTGLYQELLNDSLVNWADEDDIPDEFVNSIVVMLAGRVADRFGVPNQWVQREETEQKNIGRQLAIPYEHQTVQFEDM